MYRTKHQSRPYPFNLLEALNELNSIIPTTYDDLPNDFMGSIAYIYYEKLTQRERTVLDFRFKQNKSLYETARSVGCVSAERIRQIEERALSKIARSTTAYYLIYGVKFLIGNGVRDLSPQPEGNKISRTRGMENAHPIEELGLSTRSYNALVRSGVVSVNDILGWSDDDFLKKRRFGKSCLVEVREKLEKFKEENEI